MMRDAVVDRNYDPLFLEQKSLKEKYPMSDFLKLPEAERKMALLKSKGVHPTYASMDWEQRVAYSSEPDLERLQRQHQENFNDGSFLIDKPHPTDKNRSMLKDMEDMLGKYDKARDNTKWKNSWDMKDISAFRRHIREEYNINPKEDWFKDLKKGKYSPKRPSFDDDKEGEGAEGDETKDAKF